MVPFIIICVVAFLFVVLAINWQKIKGNLQKKPKDEKTPKQPKMDYDKVPNKQNIGYDEKEFKKHETKKVDNLNREEEIKSEPFVKINQSELDELSNKSNKSDIGRKHRNNDNVSKKESFEDFYDDDFYDEDDDVNLNDLHDMYEPQETSKISEEIKHLSPELKAILISNLLNKKDDI